MVSRFVNPVPQMLDDAGDPLVSGKLWFFESGTNTPKATYSDINQTIANTHPVLLTGSGRTPNIFFDGSAKCILTNESAIDPFDPGEQIWNRDPVSSEQIGEQLSEWNVLFTYSSGDIVTGSDGNYYRSLQNNNNANNPTSSPSFWEQLEFLTIWNTNVTYSDGDTVKASDNQLYKSLQNSNTGNDPTTDNGTWWGSPIEEALALQISTTDLGTKSAEAVAIDVSADTLYEFTAAGDFTLSFSSIPSAGTAWLQPVKIYNAGSYSPTFPAAVKWDGGDDPVFATGSTSWSMVNFYSDDGGTNIAGKLAFEDVDES